MKNRIPTTKPLAFAFGFLSLALTGAAHHTSGGSAENTVLDTGTPRVEFADVASRIKLFGLTGSEAPQFVFTPSLTLAAGYATNPDQASVRSGSYFLGSSLNLDVERADASTRSRFLAGYEAAGTFFEHDHDTNDQIDQILSAAYQRELTPGLNALLSAGFTHVTLDYSTLLTVAGLTADLRYDFSDTYTAGFSYTYQDRDSRLPVVSLRRDADAHRHIPTVYFTTSLPKLTGQGTLPVVTVAYSQYFNLASGNDEDFRAERISLRAANWAPGGGMSLNLDVSYEDRDGENHSSRLIGLAARHDQIIRASLALGHEMLSIAKTRVSFQVGYEHARSNITSGNYEGLTFALTGTRRF